MRLMQRVGKRNYFHCSATFRFYYSVGEQYVKINSNITKHSIVTNLTYLLKRIWAATRKKYITGRNIGNKVDKIL